MKMKNKRILIAIIVVTTALFFYGCGQQDSSGAEKNKEKAKTSEQKNEKQKSEKKKAEQNKKETAGQPETIVTSKYTKNSPLVIEIDPGHGAEDSGGIGKEKADDGTVIKEVAEKDVDWTLANHLKEALQKYDNVTVFMTREENENPSLEERVNKAVADDADIVISIHNNAYGEGFRYTDGCMVLAGTGNIREDIAKKDQLLGVYILRELKQLGIADRGLLLRLYPDGETYDNGKVMDFYGIVRRSLMAGISGIIIEHAYLDDDNDYSSFLSTDKQLKKLAEADARGIAGYYRLQPVLKEQETYDSQIIYMIDDNGDHTKYTPTQFKLNKLPEQDEKQ